MDAASGPTWGTTAIPCSSQQSDPSSPPPNLDSMLSKVSGPGWCFLIRGEGRGPKPGLSDPRSRGGKFVRPETGNRELRVHPLSERR